MAALVVLVAGLAACAGTFPQSSLSPASDFSHRIDALYRTIFWWAVGVFVVVEGALLVAIVKFRDRPSAAEPKHVHGNTVLEIAWTLAPAIVLVSIAIPTMETIFDTEGPPPENALHVQVTGHQWWWEFRYPDLGITTANELHVPAGRPVALAMTSADVIHSFWVPRLGGKRDVMPRRTTHLEFAADSVGEYTGQCAEFCGDSHANMRFRVIVDSAAGFAAWSDDQKRAATPVDSLDGLVREGADEFRKIRDPANHSCLACHTIQGISGGVLGPNLTHLASRGTIAAGVLPNTPAGLREWLHDPAAVKPGSLMPTIGLSDREITALIAYLQSLK